MVEEEETPRGVAGDVVDVKHEVGRRGEEVHACFCMCHVPREKSSPPSGIVFSAGLKQEAPAPPVSWCVALLSGSAVCCDSQSWKCV